MAKTAPPVLGPTANNKPAALGKLAIQPLPLAVPLITNLLPVANVPPPGVGGLRDVQTTAAPQVTLNAIEGNKMAEEGVRIVPAKVNTANIIVPRIEGTVLAPIAGGGGKALGGGGVGLTGPVLAPAIGGGGGGLIQGGGGGVVAPKVDVVNPVVRPLSSAASQRALMRTSAANVAAMAKATAAALAAPPAAIVSAPVAIVPAPVAIVAAIAAATPKAGGVGLVGPGLAPGPGAGPFLGGGNVGNPIVPQIGGAASVSAAEPKLNPIINPIMANRLLDIIQQEELEDTLPIIEIAEPRIRPERNKYLTDTLSVAETRIQNGQFSSVYEEGISAYRPEIISVVDFLSIWNPGGNYNDKLSSKETSNIGNLINIQYQLGHLRQETLLNLISNMKKDRAGTFVDEQFRKIKDQYNVTLEKVDGDIRSFENLIATTNTIKRALNIRSIPDNLFNEKFLNITEFFSRKLQYSKEQVKLFSNTKILLQLLSDLKAITENYSFGLLDLIDPDRIADESPINIDRSFTLTSGFNFNISSLRSMAGNVNATEINFFNQFINSLPSNVDEKIRVLTVVLAKEYLISKGLSDQKIIDSLRITYDTQSAGSPFNNIIGEVGDSILDKVRGVNSLSSLMFVDDPNTPGALILPFETKYIDKDESSAYVPGSAYFVDSILNVVNMTNFNTGPYLNFASTFNQLVTKARKAFITLFDIDNENNSLSPIKVNDTLLGATHDAISGLTDSNQINTDQALIVALFNLASTDNILKNMLFQFCLLVGMSGNGRLNQQKEIFKLLAIELDNIRQLSQLQVQNNENPNLRRGLIELRPYLLQLAESIENRVNMLTTNTREIIQGANVRNLVGNINANIPAPVIRADNFNAVNVGVLNAIGALTNITRQIDADTIQIQRGHISTVLMSTVTNRAQNASNFINEFVTVANKLAVAAQTQGTNSYLLEDSTNRTRYNYINTSTQLLILFELISSYAVRYTDALFENTTNLDMCSITVNIRFNKFIFGILSAITRLPVTRYTSEDVTNLGQGLIVPNAQQQGVGPRPGVQANKQGRSHGPAPDNDGFPDGGGGAVANAGGAAGDLPNQVENTQGQGLEAVFDVPGVGIDFWNNFLDADNTQLITNAADINAALLGLGGYMSFVTSLSINRTKINDEIKTILNALHLLSVISVQLNDMSTRIQGIYNEEKLRIFIRDRGITNLSWLQNPAQVRTARYILDNIKEKTPTNVRLLNGEEIENSIVISDVVTSSEYETFLSLFSEHQYRPASSKSTKILSVGLPAGLSKTLADRISIPNINKVSFQNKEFDVVYINVYRRDARFDDIVFKPQKYVFDLSLYVLDSDVDNIQPRPEENFNNLLKRVQLTDYNLLNSPAKVNMTNIEENTKYDFLSIGDKRKLVRNHIVSHFLKLYVNFITGLKISEESFLQNGSAEGFVSREFSNILLTYLRDVKNLTVPLDATIESMLQMKNLDTNVKDILTLFSNGNIVFSPSDVQSKVLNSKIFDRVFNIPLYIEDFEVDLDLTLSTASGAAAWRQTYVQEAMVQRDNKFYIKERDQNDLIFEDYFVAIETGKK